MPTGASFAPDTRDFSWKPTFKQAGEYEVTFIVTASGVSPASDSETIIIIVVDVSQPSQSSQSGYQPNYSWNFMDYQQQQLWNLWNQPLLQLDQLWSPLSQDWYQYRQIQQPRPQSFYLQPYTSRYNQLQPWSGQNYQFWDFTGYVYQQRQSLEYKNPLFLYNYPGYYDYHYPRYYNYSGFQHIYNYHQLNPLIYYPNLSQSKSQPAPSTPVIPTSINLEPEHIKLTYLGQTQAFTVSIIYSDMSTEILPVDTTEITYSSSDPNIATIDKFGLVTAVGKGTASITATSNSVSDKSTVIVCVPISFDTFSLSVNPKDATFTYCGQTEQLTATLTYTITYSDMSTEIST